MEYLVPLVHFINHSPGDERKGVYTYANAFLYEDGDDDNFKLFAYGGGKSGTECYVSYGKLSNETLLSRYGFALQNNPEDFVDVRLPVKVRLLIIA